MLDIKTADIYSGQVEANLVRKKKIKTIQTHNTSTTTMSLLFAKALLNQSVKEYIPTQLDLGYSGSEGSWVSILSKLKPLTGGSYKLDVDRYVTTYDILITNDNLISGVPSVELSARLLTTSGTPLAEVDLEINPEEINDSTSLQIIWNLTLIEQLTEWDMYEGESEDITTNKKRKVHRSHEVKGN